MKISTKKLVLTALFTALTAIATMFIRIPLPMGYFNLGDAFIFLAIFILGPVLGTVAAGVGSTIADLIGFISYAPGTLIIKSLMALVAALIYKYALKSTNKNFVSQLLAGIAGAIIMAFGYFLYETMFFTTAAVAIINLPYNLVQGAVGIVVSTAIMPILIKTNILEKLQK